MNVREIMTGRVTAVAPFDTVAFAEQLMTAEKIRHLPVVDGDVVVGVLSQRDVLAASISSVDRPLEDDDRMLKAQLRVSQIMRGFVETVRPDTDLVEAADKLLEQKIGCLPIVDERLHLLGIVTEADFVQLSRDLLARSRERPR